MSWFNNFFSRKFKLDEHDRQSIMKWFGSFHANKLALGQHNALTEGYENVSRLWQVGIQAIL